MPTNVNPWSDQFLDELGALLYRMSLEGNGHEHNSITALDAFGNDTCMYCMVANDAFRLYLSSRNLGKWIREREIDSENTHRTA